TPPLRPFPKMYWEGLPCWVKVSGGSTCARLCPPQGYEGIPMDKIVMGLQHKKWPIFGLQCHPESFLTEYGQKIIQNFIKI
ncbi:MAG: hypothetical protein KKE55_03805, partial [Candidatus Omnitrophica bacterium]|nr:hypothetical protein [Candidatus Omnitrophota bacterium]